MGAGAGEIAIESMFQPLGAIRRNPRPLTSPDCREDYRPELLALMMRKPLPMRAALKKNRSTDNTHAHMLSEIYDYVKIYVYTYINTGIHTYIHAYVCV